MGDRVTFTTSSTKATQLDFDAGRLSGPFSFAVGDLRGGSSASLHSLQTSTSGRRQQQTPVLELALAADRLEKRHRLVKIQADGRCLFRALAKALEHNQGGHVGGEKETKAADELRMAVHDALCRSKSRQKAFSEVDFSVNNLEGGRASYCKRLQQSDFWGGELEILVLSKMLHVPIYVYRTAEDASMSEFGYIPIAKYGEQWAQLSEAGKGRQPLRLLFRNGNHYDLLL